MVGRRWGAGGDAIVLIHGLGVASRMVAPLGLHLSTSASVLAPDLPGFGADADANDVEGYGALLAERIRRLDRPTVLLGCSVGSQVALHAAAHLGETLRGLILVSPTVDPARRSMAKLVLRWPAEMATQPPALVRTQAQDHRAAGPQHVFALLSSALRDTPEDLAPEVATPTLVVRGTQDPLVGTPWAEDLTARLPRGDLEVVRGRHAMTFTEPRLLGAIVRRFVDAL
jgi:pimeloyl-ACP methyl ester carboxylesterase